MSTHSVNVVRVNALEKHPNADALSLVRVGGFTVAVRSDEWKPGDLGAYVEPDYLVPGFGRIAAKRLRGVWSEGLLLKAPEGAEEGDDVMGAMGITRYEPPLAKQFVGRGAGVPIGLADGLPRDLMLLPKYDLENWKKFPDVIDEKEPVYVTEKIHGSNARYCFLNGQLWCGSRAQWRKPEPTNFYWEAAKNEPWIEEWCRANEGLVLLGETYGMQDLRYYADKVAFLAFDVCDLSGTFLSPRAFCSLVHADCRVPCFWLNGVCPRETLLDFAERNSALATRSLYNTNHIQEGLVIKPMAERFDKRVGRVALKLVSNRYLSR